MKATKALKRLAKIEALMSDVTERYPGGSPAIRKTLRDAMAAVTVAKAAVSLDASSGAAPKPAMKKAGPTSNATPKSPRAKQKQSPAAAPSKPAVNKAEPAKAAKKVEKTAVKKAAAKKTAPVVAQVVTEGSG